MTYSFLPPARQELHAAVDYYEGRRKGLGAEFAAEVHRTILRIQANPTAWKIVIRSARRCRTRRFPYSVIYSIREDDILIVAIMHVRRRPDYWRDRLA